jgi:hypothetical protein
MLSSIPYSDLIAELNQDADAAVLTDAEKIDAMNTAGQEACTIYYNNRRLNWKKNNLATPIPASSQDQNERRGFGTASILGDANVFTTPFPLPYALAIDGYKNGQKMGADQFDPALLGNPLADTRTINGFTGFAPENGVIIEYRAYKPL